MRFEQVYLGYARRSAWVLTDVTVRLEAGRMAVVLGRNGVGKTTLLSAAAGLLRAERPGTGGSGTAGSEAIWRVRR
jgi:ABC-2 type transport system ATP-binding protein